ncbi:hypothetical protein BH23CHL5_BH23CHL5_23190 [soil metagenome]
MPGELSPAHRRMLEIESGIAAAVIDARGYRTVTKAADLQKLGFTPAQRNVPALVIPVYDIHGELATYQARPEVPRIVKGKPLKYETPGGSRMALDVPQAVRPHLANPERPLWITEGAKKADSAVSHDLDCIALLGVWNWRGTNDHGGKAILPAFEHIAFNGRRVYLAFDSDVTEKEAVWLALTRFGGVMKQRGADVWVVRLPHGPSGSKTGLDDFLAAGGSVDDLVRTAEPLASFAANKPGGPYRVEHGGIWYSPNPETDRQLCNFTATIETDIVLDDGAETRRVLEIVAEHRGREHHFSLPAERFAGMNWPVDQLGASAILNPGQSTREHARVAIQTLSGNIPTRHEYAHTGWATVDGERVYLSGSGAIGAGGLIPDVAVSLSGTLSGYELPEPPTGDTLIAAIRSSLGMLDVAPLDITGPVYSAIWRAPLGQADFSLHLAAQTGAGKSELSGLSVQHYGPSMDARHLPGSWSNTANANEALGFQVKDALMPVDDYSPTGTTHDQARYNRDADRMFRGAGNNSGRARMRADTSIREAKPIRALLLSSGEDVPKGESLRARLFVVEMAPDSMQWAILTKCQQGASKGLYAQALAGYVRWLAANPVQFERFQQLRLDYRDHAGISASHKRTPAIVADLGAAFRLYVDFTIQAGALTAEQGRELWARIWAALNATAAQQESYQAQSEPTRQFREYLSARIASGGAHLASLTGDEPANPKGHGWRIAGTGEYQGWQPQGERVGWVDDDGIYLEPKAAYASAQAIAQRSGDSLAITSGRLNKSLNEKQLLLATDPKRETLTIRKTIEGRSVAVLHVEHSFINSPITAQKPDKPDIEADSATSDGDSAQEMSGFLSGIFDLNPEPDIEHAPETRVNTGGNGADVGFVGNVGFVGDTHRALLENGGMISGSLEKPDKKPDKRPERPDKKPTCRVCDTPKPAVLECPNCRRTDSQAITYLRNSRIAEHGEAVAS